MSHCSGGVGSHRDEEERKETKYSELFPIAP